MRPALLALTISAAAACTHTPPAPNTTTAWTDGVRFTPMRAAVLAETATVAGAQNAAGLYTIRVKIGKGGSIPPHTHPDVRILTVVSGEVWYGFGETVDLAEAKLYATGAVFLAPANAPHWAEAATSDVVYQEAGMGPTAFVPVR
jgi:quercetin dioxygenase-like cupin family protein